MLPHSQVPGRIYREVADLGASLARIGHTLLPGDYIVGPVVLLGAPDDEGIETDVPDDVLAELREAGLEVREA